MSIEVWKLLIILAFALLFIIAVLNSVADARKAALEALKHAIDKGHPLDPHTVNQLLGRREPNPRFLLFPGIMAIATGVGLGIASTLASARDHEDLAVGSAIVFCLGIGLVVSSLVMSKK